MTIAEKKIKLEKIMGEVRAISGSGYISKSDEARCDLLLKEAERLTAEIAGDNGNRATGRKFPDGFDYEMTGSRRREDRGDGTFNSFGEYLAAVINAHQPGSGTIDERLRQPQYNVRAATGLGEAPPESGGFAVSTDFEDRILTKIYDANPWINLLDRREIGPNANSLKIPSNDETSRADGSRFGGVRGYWTNEAAALTASAPKFGQLSMELEKVTVLVYLTSELMQDSVSMAAFVEDACRKELGFKLGDAIINGTGSGQPLGILSSGCLVTQDKEGSQTATTIVYENIVNMWSRMWPASRANAVWLCNSDIIPQLYTMSLAVGTGGAAVFMPADGAAGRPYNTLFTRPIYFTEFNPTLGTEGDILLIDPTEYLQIEKGGVQSATSIHVRFVNDEVVLRFVYRTNGQPKTESAITPFKGTATVSPFVSLQTRS